MDTWSDEEWNEFLQRLQVHADLGMALQLRVMDRMEELWADTAPAPTDAPLHISIVVQHIFV